MRYAVLGQTGVLVSRLSFGAMTFSDAAAANPIWKTGAAAAERLVHQALDASVNFFDTADAYAGGESELLLGRALKGRRDGVVIATKCGFRSGAALTQHGLSRRHIIWSVDQSLKRLDTDWIDVLIAHREDALTPMEETLRALDDVVRAGKVRYLGFSNWPAWRASAAVEFQRANGLARFTHGQVYYSVIGRDVERDLAPMMRAYGLGMTVWSPLAGGFLSGKYGRETQAAAEDRLTSFDIIPFDRAKGFDAVDVLRAVAQRHGRTPAQVALAWLMSKPVVTSVILGASKPEQLADNLGAVDLALTEADIAALDACAAPEDLYPAWLTRRLTDPILDKALA